MSLTNTLSRKKESFAPADASKVKLYVCGITPYDYSHLGHGRAYINFDLLVRLLKFLGHNVTFVRNFTDIDDKIINKAIQEGIPEGFRTIAERYIDAYHQDMYQLNCIEPNYEPRVTQYIPEIIEFTSKLIDKGHAYIVDHDVYFDIASFPSYGKLSGKKLEDLAAGVRVEVDARKKNPGDFALWKGNEEGKFWSSPWGHGRPGWHIECSVMANALLGETLDIHGGGQDLMFPHHENEIAQSECLHNAPLSHFWLHNAFININKEKMSKSLGNFLTLRDTFKTFDPMVIRFFMLQHHYRTPIDFNDEDVQAAQVAYKKIVTSMQAIDIPDEQTESYLNIVMTHPITKAMLEALCDDLNTPKFLGLVFENLKQCDNQTAVLVKILLQSVLGLTLKPLDEEMVIITPEIQELIDARQAARAAKDWARADALRDQLTELGVEINDKKL
ncbi:cysteine--tRNA ligase [Candidatus Dependentiae bacterium]|nr:cysteine--tRNA ligase [Candidatus Dependentiae bacterium]